MRGIARERDLQRAGTFSSGVSDFREGREINSPRTDPMGRSVVLGRQFGLKISWKKL